MKNRKMLIVCVIIFIVIILIHVVSLFTMDKIIEYKEISFKSTKVSTNINGYKIAFITDTHSMTVDDLNMIVPKLNELEINILILGGDFPSKNDAPKHSMEVLSKIKTTDGIYGVEGNHDNYIKLFEAMELYSIYPLANSGTSVRDGFFVAGVEDLWNRKPDVEKAIDGAKEEDFVLLVSHNPDVAMKYDLTGVDLMLSGHTHGGQVTFFGIWAPALTLRKNITEYGQRFMSGWSKSKDNVPVYVSNGTGYLTDVPRLFARPQIIIITLESISE